LPRTGRKKKGVIADRHGICFEGGKNAVNKDVYNSANTLKTTEVFQNAKPRDLIGF
jgi:hypothetical protein